MLRSSHRLARLAPSGCQGRRSSRHGAAQKAPQCGGSRGGAGLARLVGDGAGMRSAWHGSAALQPPAQALSGEPLCVCFRLAVSCGVAGCLRRLGLLVRARPEPPRSGRAQLACEVAAGGRVINSGVKRRCRVWIEKMLRLHCCASSTLSCAAAVSILPSTGQLLVQSNPCRFRSGPSEAVMRFGNALSNAQTAQ